MLNSIATVSISGPLSEKLAAIAEAGFDAAEIFDNDLIASDLSAADVGRMMRDLGLGCCALQPFRDFEGMPAEVRPAIFDRVERKFDVMEALGADLLLVCSNVSPRASPDLRRCAEDLYELGERAARRGLRVTYEALAWGAHVFDHRQAWALVQAAAHPAVGLTLDTFHSLARGIPVDTLAGIDPARIFLVQVADAPRREMNLLSWSRHSRCLPGQGELPVLEFLEAVVRLGFDGPLSLEIFNDHFRSAGTDAIARDGMRSLRMLRDDIERRVAGGSGLPPRAHCEGVEFIEFAATEAETPSLEAIFRQLGFSRCGRHRSKAVTRWRQGEINLVVNTEPDSFARSFAHAHGASPCAIGLRVDDATAARARCAGLGASPFSIPPNPGELELPGVVGVGGSVIYFTQPDGDLGDVWSIEFVPEEPELHGSGAGLTGVDHLGQIVRADDILSWRLYYASMFDVAASPAADIIDPSGLVHSTWIESRTGGLKVMLTEGEGRETLAARFLRRFFGNGLQHIALTCPDVFAAADAIVSAGGELLAIPPNYYEDLAARLGLSEGFVSRLAAHNVLYDRTDAGGELLRIVTRAHERRFFFEILERRGGYSGVDPWGTQVRLAAQSRFKAPELP